MPQVGDTYYTVYDDQPIAGPPIVLIHEAGCNLHSWGVEIRRLQGHRVLALDLPGHGRSPGIGQQSIAAYAAGVIRFLDSARIYQPIVVGHGMGGAIAIELALNYPDRLAAAGLVACGASLPVAPGLLDQLCHPGTLPEALNLLQQQFSSTATTPTIAAAIRRQLQSTRPGVLYNDWLACQRFDRRADIKNVRVPLWAAVGASDRLGMQPCAHYLAARLPRMSLRVFPNAGHMLPLEQSRSLAEGLQAFLQELPTRKPGRRPVRE